MQECPVCQTSYNETEGTLETCSNCGWDLRFHSTSGFGGFGFKAVSESSLKELQEKAIASAKNIWAQKEELQSQVKSLQADKEQLENEVNSLTSENNKIKSDLEKEQEEKRKLQTQLSELTEQDQLHQSPEDFTQEPQQKLSGQKDSQFSNEYLTDFADSSGEANEENLKTNELETPVNSIQELQEKISKLELDLQQIKQHYTPSTSLDKLAYNIKVSIEKIIESINKKFNFLEARLQKLEGHSPEAAPYPSPETSYTGLNPEDTLESENPQAIPPNEEEDNLKLTSDEQQLVNDYNNNIDLFKIVVSETQDSQNSRRGGSQEPAIFSEDKRGNYWIINSKNKQYLVPKPKIKINEHNSQTVGTLFECRGYQSGISSDFKLVKPGKVTSSVSGETWKLDESGILKF